MLWLELGFLLETLLVCETDGDRPSKLLSDWPDEVAQLFCRPAAAADDDVPVAVVVLVVAAGLVRGALDSTVVVPGFTLGADGFENVRLGFSLVFVCFPDAAAAGGDGGSYFGWAALCFLRRSLNISI